MEAHLTALLAELEQHGRENDARESDHKKKMLNLEPDTARLVYILARSSGAKRVLEIGTSNGYSTIWLASAVAPNGGRVTSIDLSAEKQGMAHENLQRAGLLESVELVLGKAGTIVKELVGPFDVVFFDADRLGAAANLEALMPKLAPSVLLLADNVTSHPDEIAGYLTVMKKLEGFEHVVVPVGKGLSVAYRGQQRRGRKRSKISGQRGFRKMSDKLVIAGRAFNSRLIVGTGKYRSFQEMARAHAASGADMVTVAVRRVNLTDRSKESLLDYIDRDKIFILPNTAGCYSADEAMRTARLGREVGFPNG